MPGAVIVRSDIERKALFGIARASTVLPVRKDRRRR
jgi:predicted kinase